jgi:hypothetical protein
MLGVSQLKYGKIAKDEAGKTNAEQILWVKTVEKHNQKGQPEEICVLMSDTNIECFNLKIAVFWVVAPCSLVEVYQRFRGPCWLHHGLNDRSSIPKHFPLRQSSLTLGQIRPTKWKLWIMRKKFTDWSSGYLKDVVVKQRPMRWENDDDFVETKMGRGIFQLLTPELSWNKWGKPRKAQDRRSHWCIEFACVSLIWTRL